MATTIKRKMPRDVAGLSTDEKTTARAGLGLASMATQAASAVAITGGSVAGITDLAVADGGTGASTASAARTNLGLSRAIVTVDSIADLKALTVSPALSQVEVLGYYTPGDGGGGVFNYASGSSAADNLGTIIQPSVGSGRWLRIYSGSLYVRWFGAKGDGSTDDSAAFQSAFTLAATATRTSIYLTEGRFRINSTITITPDPLSGGQNHLFMDVLGNGKSSQILHYASGALFSFTGLIHNVSFRNLNIVNKRTSTVATEAAFYFPDGNSQSAYENITYLADVGSSSVGSCFYYVDSGEENDSVSFLNCYVACSVIAYNIGEGSSIFLDGGRCIGNYPTSSTGIGLNLTGGNGGVWIWATDFINHGKGIRIADDSGTTNREIFLVQSAVDSCKTGLSIEDGSYVSIEGVWAASCDEANISFNPNSQEGVLVISGGTIFNAGVGGTDNKYGLSIGAMGMVQVSGVTFRNNKNRAISFNSSAATRRRLIENNRFSFNGDAGIGGSVQVYLSGLLVFKGNTFEASTVDAVSVDSGTADDMYICDNAGYTGINLRTGLSVGSSGATVANDTGQTILLYFRGGTVNSIWINGAPVYDYGGGGATANASITLLPGDTFRVDYASVPSVINYFA